MNNQSRMKLIFLGKGQRKNLEVMPFKYFDFESATISFELYLEYRSEDKNRLVEDAFCLM